MSPTPLPAPSFEDFADAMRTAYEGAGVCGRLFIHESIDSTNAHLLRQVETGLAKEHDTHIAYEQTAGRGTGARSWWSPAGAGMWLSRLESIPNSPAPFAFWPAVAAAEALGNLGFDAHLKWPNDVLVGDAKLGGCLIQTCRSSDRTEFAAVGIGLNVHQQSFPDTVNNPATSLSLSGDADPSLSAVMVAWLRRFEELGKQNDLIPSFRSACRMLGHTITATAGDQTVFVRAADLDAAGHLVVVNENGDRDIWTSGDHYRILIDEEWAIRDQ